MTAPRVRVIPPPVPQVIERSAAQREHALAALRLPQGAPYFVYPGDLETSSGAETSARIAERVDAVLPGAVVVLAFRRKTPRALEVSAALRRRLDPARVRLVDSTPDVLSLIAGANGVIFPVDDLFGKVDLPIVLLEAMVLGVPVITLAAGPLLELKGAIQVRGLEPDAWLTAMRELVVDQARVTRCLLEQRQFVSERVAAERVAAAYEELYLELVDRAARAPD